MTMSTELRRAVAAAAVTRLNAGRRNLDAAARWVTDHLGEAVFPDHEAEARPALLLGYRKRILGVDPQNADAGRLGVARFHYDACLKWIDESGLKPEESARLLLDTLRREA